MRLTDISPFSEPPLVHNWDTTDQTALQDASHVTSIEELTVLLRNTGLAELLLARAVFRLV